MCLVGYVVGRDQLLAWRHRRFVDGARRVSVAAPPEVTPESAAALWATMTGVLTPSIWRRRLYGTPHVAWEYTWTGRTLTLRLWVPGTIPPGAVEAAVRGAWPACTVATDEAGPPIPATVVEQAGGALWPQEADTLPLRTEHDADPLRALLSAGAGVRDREHACVQILARPASARQVRRARKAASATASTAAGPDAATKAVNGMARVAIEPILWLIEVFLPGPSPRRRATGSNSRPEGRPAGRDPVAEAYQRSVAEKAVRVPHFEIAVRYAVAAEQIGNSPISDQRRREIRQRLAGLAHTFASAAATYTRPNRLRRMKMAHPVAVLASRRLLRGFLATVEELAVLAALPQDLAVPGLDRARAKAMPAPAAIPSGGRSVKVLGRAQIGGHAVGLQVVDARQHVHLIGKTGVGKTTVMLNMILSDVHAGQDHVEQHRGLADAGLADQVHVLPGVDHLQAHGVPADLRSAEHLHAAPAGGDRRRRRHRLGSRPVQARHGQILRQGRQDGQLLHSGQEPAQQPPPRHHGHRLGHLHPPQPVGAGVGGRRRRHRVGEPGQPLPDLPAPLIGNRCAGLLGG